MTTVTISNDTMQLGPEGTEEALEAYRRALQDKLNEEFDDEIRVILGSVYSTVVTGSDDVCERVAQIEAGHEWVELLNQGL